MILICSSIKSIFFKVVLLSLDFSDLFKYGDSTSIICLCSGVALLENNRLFAKWRNQLCDLKQRINSLISAVGLQRS